MASVESTKIKGPSKINENVDTDNNDGNEEIMIPDPQNMCMVLEEYKRLQDSISTIGAQVSTVLHKQEDEFLNAYKAHMRNVTRDFHKLRDDINEKETAIENNVLVKQLENERDWYKKEALHLDSVLGKTKKRETALIEKLEELENDRSWLSNQLKDVMKEKNMLERRLEEGDMEIDQVLEED